MSKNKYFEHVPHRRYNILSDEWIQVSPHRTKRPWQGKQEKSEEPVKASYDPGCYLCPGNERAGGKKNPHYTSTYAFDNDFSALLPDTEKDSVNRGDLLVAETEKGICRVICFNPNHNLTLPEMTESQVREVVQLWMDEYRELASNPFINYVQIFENKGEIMGCSNPHPHGQIWAQQSIPEEPLKELRSQTVYFKKHGSTMLGDYLETELRLDERVVVENEHFVVLVPFWAFWPFETIVISRRPFSDFMQLSKEEADALADIIRRLTIKYDNLFETSFPYSAGFHPAPADGKPHPEWHFHMHFYPPLLRSASIKKFRVGYEMLANPQRDITAEKSAEYLMDHSEIHYKSQADGFANPS